MFLTAFFKSTLGLGFWKVCNLVFGPRYKGNWGLGFRFYLKILSNLEKLELVSPLFSRKKEVYEYRRSGN
jgi:hypothetical protein